MLLMSLPGSSMSGKPTQHDEVGATFRTQKKALNVGACSVSALSTYGQYALADGGGTKFSLVTK